MGEIYVNEHLPFAVNLAEYIRKKVLAVPRCCENMILFLIHILCALTDYSLHGLLLEDSQMSA
jgi:hypothetical protein